MRTPEQFVSEMLKKKRSWSAILAVASQVRGGRWRADVRRILVEKGLVPSDHLEEIKQRDKIIEEQRISKDRREKEERANRLVGLGRKDRNTCSETKSKTETNKDGSQENNASGGMRRSRKKS